MTAFAKQGALFLVSLLLVFSWSPTSNLAYALDEAGASNPGVTGANNMGAPGATSVVNGVSSTGTPQNPSPSITHRQYYLSGEKPPSVPSTVLDGNNNQYRLSYSDAPVLDAAYTPQKKVFSTQIIKDVDKNDINNLEAYFPKTVHVNEGQFEGDIGLASTPYDSQSIYESFTAQVDKYYTIYGVPVNDVANLPQQMKFEVRADASFGATEVKTLNLLSVEYEVNEANDLGRPISYTAHMVFRGQESYLELHHYNVVANYAGELSSSVRQYVLTSHYDFDDEDLNSGAVVGSTAAPVQIPEPPVPHGDAEQPNILLAVAAGMVLVSAIALLLIWAFFWRKNAVLVELDEDGKRKVLQRKRIQVINSEATFVVLDKLHLLGSCKYSIELKAEIASKMGELVVVWRKNVIARDSLKHAVSLRINDLKNEGVLAAITGDIINEVAELKKAS